MQKNFLHEEKLIYVYRKNNKSTSVKFMFAITAVIRIKNIKANFLFRVQIMTVYNKSHFPFHISFSEVAQRVYHHILLYTYVISCNFI